MKLTNYVFDKETVHKQAEAYQGEESMTGKGTLACTSKRVVFVSGKDVTDISIKNVTAMEYSAKRYPRSYTMATGVFGFLAGILLLIGTASDIDIAMLGGMASAAIGLGILIVGIFLRRASLRIHTPGKTFNFTSYDDLAEMAHMIRGQESR